MRNEQKQSERVRIPVVPARLLGSAVGVAHCNVGVQVGPGTEPACPAVLSHAVVSTDADFPSIQCFWHPPLWLLLVLPAEKQYQTHMAWGPVGTQDYRIGSFETLLPR